MAKLIRTAFLIGLAVTWHPDAAAGQYSWSNFSVSVGFGTGGAGFGVGASYAAVDPFYDVYYEDPWVKSRVVCKSERKLLRCFC